MNKLTFKTNIKCTGCIDKVTPVLNQMQQIQHWEVDLQASDKTLTIIGKEIAPEQVVQALTKIGYQAVPIAD